LTVMISNILIRCTPGTELLYSYSCQSISNAICSVLFPGAARASFVPPVTRIRCSKTQTAMLLGCPTKIVLRQSWCFVAASTLVASSAPTSSSIFVRGVKGPKMNVVRRGINFLEMSFLYVSFTRFRVMTPPLAVPVSRARWSESFWNFEGYFSRHWGPSHARVPKDHTPPDGDNDETRADGASCCPGSVAIAAFVFEPTYKKHSICPLRAT
jgi:hypothetical protein